MVAAMSRPDEPRRILRLELGPRSVGWVLLGLLAVWLAVQLWTVAIVLVVATILAGTLSPLVRGLERRGVGRGVALALIYLGVFVTVAGVLLLTVPTLVTQLLHILENAKGDRARLIAYLSQYELGAPLARSIRAVPFDELFAGATTRLVGYSSELLAALGYGVTTLFLSIYLLADAKRVHGAIYALVPRHYHLRLARILLNLETIVGGYMRGQLITSVAISVFVFALLTILHVPNALALALFAGLTDIIPMIGGILASAPSVVAALGRGTPTVVGIAVALFLYQEFESRILVPRLYGRVLRISPVVVLLALMIGGTLLGILGALLALPIAAGLQMIVRELRVELPGATDDPRARVRDATAEATYEALSAGAAPVEAAAIAHDLVHKIRDTETAGVDVTARLAALRDPAAPADPADPAAPQPVDPEASR
jgi:predicted PurR-regulated permease PerM